MDVITLENRAFRAYLFYGSLLVIKTMAMSLLTARQRFKNKAFTNSEDVAYLKTKPKADENVERIRRAHLNDLENIPLFLFVALGFIFTKPSDLWAVILFRVFMFSRIIHTIVYAIYVVPQPARALSFSVGFLVIIYMALQVIWNIHPF